MLKYIIVGITTLIIAILLPKYLYEAQVCQGHMQFSTFNFQNFYYGKIKLIGFKLQAKKM